MITIGIRSTVDCIYYSIINISDETFSITNEKLIIPKSFDQPQQFKYIRKTFLDIFLEYNITRAGIRIAEHNSKNIATKRVKFEAIIEELIASSKVEKYFVGVKNQIEARIKDMLNTEINHYIEGKEIFSEIDTWTTFSKEHRECVLTAFSTL